MATAALLLDAASARPQEQRGEIRGIVRVPVAAPPAGTTVILEGSFGRLETSPDREGSFRFPPVPPGAVVVTASAPGIEQVNACFYVFLGARIELELELPGTSDCRQGLEGLSGATDEIAVTSEGVGSSLPGAETVVSVLAAELDLLPHGPDLVQAAALAANAQLETAAGGLSLGGASGAENRYFVDGVDTTHPMTGLPGKPVRTEHIAEIQVKTAGYRAEFGGATGGVVNVVTLTASDRWRWGLGLAAGDSGLDGDPRGVLIRSPDEMTAAYRTYREDSRQTLEPQISVGGPLLPSRLWLFGAYLYSATDTDRTVDFVTGPEASFSQRRVDQAGTVSVGGLIASNSTWRVSGAWTPSETSRSLPAVSGSGSANPDDYRFGSQHDNGSRAASLDALLHPRFTLGLRWAVFDFDTRTTQVVLSPFETGFLGTPGQFPEVPPELVRPAGFQSGPRYDVLYQDRWRRSTLNLEAGLDLHTGGSAHGFKIGIQAEDLKNDVRRTGNATRHTFGWNQRDQFYGERGRYGYLQVENPGVFGVVRGEAVAIFLQDSWRLGSTLTFEIGLRAEQERIPDYRAGSEGSTAIGFDFDEKLAPRLGFAWNPRRDTVLRGSFGTYYDTTKYQMPRGSFGADRRVLYLYALDSFDWTAVDCVVTDNNPQNPPDCGLPLIGTVNLRNSSLEAVDPNILPTESEEWQVGAEHQLRALAGSRLGLTWTRKRLVRMIEDIGAFDPVLGAEIYAIGNPGEGESAFALPGLALPRAQRRFDAVELHFDRPLRDGWLARASYTWSRLEGNFPGLANSDEAGRAAPNFTRAWDGWHNLFGQDGQAVDGRLPTDRPHQLKVQAVWSHAQGFAVGLNQYAGSGTPVSTTASRQAVPFFPYGRGDMGRTPTLTQTDLRLSWKYNFGSVESELWVTVLNLFDESTPTGIATSPFRGEVRLTDDEFRAGFTLDEVASSQGLTRDPRYGRATTFQAPRSVRFGVLTRF